MVVWLEVEGDVGASDGGGEVGTSVNGGVG